MQGSNKLTRGLISAVGALGMVLVVAQTQALADGPASDLLTSYYDVATNVSASASGYGGAGSSGGAGDGLVRIVNPTHLGTRQNGTLCAMIYVFDDIEEMQACCGCPVTPDGLRTLSVINNLTKNFGVNSANLNAGVIDIESTDLNYQQTSTTTLPPKGINLDTSGLGLGCDPSFAAGQQAGTGSELPTSDVEGLRAWMGHTEANSPIPASTTFVKTASLEEFADAPVDENHEIQLRSFCDFLLRNGSGTGTCSCGSGDNASTHVPR